MTIHGVYGAYFEPGVSPLRLDAFYDDATRFAPGVLLLRGRGGASAALPVTLDRQRN